jgi:type III restriction enzyme
VPGVNNLKTYGRWAFAEFTDVYAMEHDFAKKVEAEFNKMIETVATSTMGESK